MDDSTLKRVGRAVLMQAFDDYVCLQNAETLRDYYSESSTAPVGNRFRDKFDYFQGVIEETHDSVDWFLSEDNTPFSFVQLCNMFGLDHEYIRRHLDSVSERTTPRFVRPENYSGLLVDASSSNQFVEHRSITELFPCSVQVDMFEGEFAL
jgi:hypothetical protein